MKSRIVVLLCTFILLHAAFAPAEGEQLDLPEIAADLYK